MEQMQVIRMLRRKPNIFPVVRLETRPMKTDFGPRLRPHMQVIDWRELGGEDNASPAPLTSPSTPQLAAPPPAPAPTPAASTPAPTPTSARPAPTPASAPSTAPTAPIGKPVSVLEGTKQVKAPTTAEVISDELPPWA